MDNDTHRNGPYKNMETGHDEIRPGFLRRLRREDERESKKDNATAGLKSAEDSASGAVNRAGDGVRGAAAKESGVERTPGGFFSGVGKPLESLDRASKIKTALKKGGPVGAIIALMMIVGGLMLGAQSLQPFSLLEQFRETFNSMQTSVSKRSGALFRYQMNTGLVKNPLKVGLFDSNTFKISKSQAAKLAKNGIEYDEDYNGTGTRVLKYEDAAGETKIVTADNFKTVYETDQDFYMKYNNGSLTWRGAIANWFGTNTDNFLKGNKMTRNLFDSFRKKVEDTGESPRTTAIDLMAKGTDEVTEGNMRMVTAEETQEQVYNADGTPKVDDKGNPVTTSSVTRATEELQTGGRLNTRNLTDSDVKVKMNDIADKIGGKAQSAANYACLVFNTLGSISLLISAREALQVVNLVTSYFEAIDKVKAGDGDDSPINDLMQALNQPKTSSYEVIANSLGGTGITADNLNASVVTDSGVTTLRTDSVTQTKTGMESSGIVSMYSGGRVNANDPSVKSFNFAGSITTILGGLGVGMASFKTCSVAKMVTNGASAAADLLKIGACVGGAAAAILTGGFSLAACAPLIEGMGLKLVASVAAATLIAAVVSSIVPAVANIMTRDLITDLGGEDLGNALTSGANMYLGNAHRSNGGSLATREEYLAYAVEHEKVVADNAKYERSKRDPFDATSQYTFLGTLTKQVMGLMSVSSLSSAVTSASTVVSSSLIALTPTASAYSINNDIVYTDEEYEEICPYLASIGAVGDAFCNPYAMTDTSTIEMDPSEVVAKIEDNFIHKKNEDGEEVLDTTSEGNVKIGGKSDLAKYILYCDNRTSAFGVDDQNIANQLTSWGQVQGAGNFNNAINSAIGVIPLVGDVIDIVDSAQGLDNIGYISGESCVAGNSVSYQASPGWDKAQYYQRFIEDQSLMESMGLIDESAVTAFLNDYYAENPLDNSYEGILARYSGLAKDDVIALLDFIDYGTFVANYNPAESYAFGKSITVEKPVWFENEDVVAENYIVLVNTISYADVRNRVNVV